MAELNARLRVDERMRSQLVGSTSLYISRRDTEKQLGASHHPGGGPDRVKCLHAHVAHQLVTGDNPVGRATLDHLDWLDPKEPCV